MKRFLLLFFCLTCLVWAQENVNPDEEAPDTPPKEEPHDKKVPSNDKPPKKEADEDKEDEFNPVKALAKISLTNAGGKKIKGASSVANKKYIALYFSAHWCGPCRAFTPELVKFRNHCVQNGLPFEVIFISHDKSKDEMSKYMSEAEMKWPAVPYDSPLRGQIQKHFKVGGIPTLILLNGKGKVVSSDARWDVQMLGNKAYKRWQSPNYKPLTYKDFTQKKGDGNPAKKDAKPAKKNEKKNNKKNSKTKNAK